MCINQCIVHGWLFRAKLVNADNSARYKIINNERELEMVYTPNHRAHFNENHSSLNRMGELGRHVSVKTVVLNGSFGQYLT